MSPDLSGGDKKAIHDPGLQRFGLRAADGWVHALDSFAVKKLVHVIGAFIRDQMPDGLGELLQWGHQIGTPGTAGRVTMGLVDAAQPLFSPSHAALACERLP